MRQITYFKTTVSDRKLTSHSTPGSSPLYVLLLIVAEGFSFFCNIANLGISFFVYFCLSRKTEMIYQKLLTHMM